MHYSDTIHRAKFAITLFLIIYLLRCGQCTDNNNQITWTAGAIYVTRFGKTLRMGFFQKIEFDAWLISSTIELTRVQVLAQPGFVVEIQRTTPPIIEKLRSKGVAMHAYGVSAYYA